MTDTTIIDRIKHHAAHIDITIGCGESGDPEHAVVMREAANRIAVLEAERVTATYTALRDPDRIADVYYPLVLAFNATHVHHGASFRASRGQVLAQAPSHTPRLGCVEKRHLPSSPSRPRTSPRAPDQRRRCSEVFAAGDPLGQSTSHECSHVQSPGVRCARLGLGDKHGLLFGHAIEIGDD